ncbi:hypothetical protein BGZ83_007851 [Gryganskiella cystojenkinii]|nr:hypothetical protein BGZ83_007851 [Gryganskiella cystojenkinii]
MQPSNPSELRAMPAIPEILICVGQFLDRRSLVNCLQVCEEWYRLLLPLNWATVGVFSAYQDGIHPCPSYHQLYKHMTMIRQLDVYFSDDVRLVFDRSGAEIEDSPTDAEHAHLPSSTSLSPSPSLSSQLLLCPNLTSLTVCFYDPPTGKAEQSLLAMVQRHGSSLRSVSYKGSSVTKSFLEVLNNSCNILRSLTLHEMDNLKAGPWMDLYGLWSRLKVLSLGTWCDYGSLGSGPSNTTILSWLKYAHKTTIQDLELSTKRVEKDAVVMAMVLRMQQLLILKSPSLVRLAWRVVNDPDILSPFELLVENIVDHQGGQGFQQLESLEVPCSKNIENVQFKLLLGAMPVLKELHLGRSGFNLGSWKVLRDDYPRLLTRLTRLNLEHCVQIRGAVVQEMLCSMSGLQEFRALLVRDVDIENDDRPWVCLGIRVLTLYFALTEGQHNQEQEQQQQQQQIQGREQELAQRQQAILDRLSTLIQLEELDLGPLSSMGSMEMSLQQSEDPLSCLRLTLEEGLTKLSSLDQLRLLKGPSRYGWRWGRAEAEWVLTHWRVLEQLNGIEGDGEAHKLLDPHFPSFRIYW